jgi:hypothetical protein
MDALKLLDHLSSVLTVEEYQAWKESDHYLWVMARFEGYRGANMDKLVEAGKRRRSEAWHIALDMAASVVDQESSELGLSLSSEQRERLRISWAEKLLIEQYITPPAFTGWTDCDSCGRVPVPATFQPHSINCPWCLHDS